MPETYTCSLGCKTRDGHPIRTHDGYSVCGHCAGRLRTHITEIVECYAIVSCAQLDTLESFAVPSDRVRIMRPAFGPQSPASDHLIALRDRRTVSWEQNDPHSPLAILTAWAAHVREERHQTPPDEATVTSESNTLLFNLDWLCRIEADLMVEFARELREVRDQLAAVCGEQRPKSVGRCIELVDTPEGQRYCDAWLFVPTNGDSVECRSCGREWPRSEWLWLGTLLTQGAA